MKINKKALFEWFKAIAMTALVCAPSYAMAGLAWEEPLCKIAKSMSGPLASSVGVIVIVITGILFAVGEAGSWFTKGMGVLCGLSIAFMASTWLGFVGGKSDCIGSGSGSASAADVLQMVVTLVA